MCLRRSPLAWWPPQASLNTPTARSLPQAGERGEREAAFYAHIERLHGSGGGSSGEASGGGGGGCCDGERAASGAAASSSDDGLQALSRWVPRSCETGACSSGDGRRGALPVCTQQQLGARAAPIHPTTLPPPAVGTRAVSGHTYLVLEDLAGGYTLPCALDAKLGLRTWYPWAAPALIDKYRCVALVRSGAVPWPPTPWTGHTPSAPPVTPTPRKKDAATTQASLGLRLCGVKAARPDGCEWRADRHWGKGLAAADVPAALRRFADNGERGGREGMGGDRAEACACQAAVTSSTPQ